MILAAGVSASFGSSSILDYPTAQELGHRGPRCLLISQTQGNPLAGFLVMLINSFPSHSQTRSTHQSISVRLFPVTLMLRRSRAPTPNFFTARRALAMVLKSQQGVPAGDLLGKRYSRFSWNEAPYLPAIIARL